MKPRCASRGTLSSKVSRAFITTVVVLVLRSLKTIRKEAAIVAMILGRSSPDPGIGSPVELSGSDASGLLNLIRVGKALAGQRIATEKAPPALLQVEPARESRE